MTYFELNDWVYICFFYKMNKIRMIDITGLPSVFSKLLKRLKETNELQLNCLELFEKADLGLGGALANMIRNRKHGNKTYFNKNFRAANKRLSVPVPSIHIQGQSKAESWGILMMR